MDPVIDRVRAANPVSEDEFAGLTDFDALTPPKRRRRLRLLSVPALGAIVAALVLIPSSTPQASEIIARSALALDVDGGILYARSHASIGPTAGGPRGWEGSRQVWVLGDQAMRWLEDGGNEEVYAKGKGTTRREPNGKLRTEPTMIMVPGEIFRARALADWKGEVQVEETTLDGRDAYALRWSETRGVKIDFTLWVDRESYAPLRFTDHSSGNDYKGRPFDQTYVEDILEYKVLEDTPANRQLLELK